MALPPGSQLGPYEIRSASASGGAGEAYTARDTRLERIVAIEVVPRHLVSQPELRQRFEDEAKAVAALQHPNIRTLHDIGRERPRPAGDSVPDTTDEAEVDFLVLEHLEGESVADRLAKASSTAKRRHAFGVGEAMAIAIQIADALDKAHQKGLVHRGLTPASVFLTRGAGKSDPPVAKLLDLGLVAPALTASAAADAAVAGMAAGGGLAASLMPTREQATAESVLVGAVDYLAPEQIEGKAADPRTDLFAFGAVFYEMLTGKKAFEGKSRAVLMAAIMTAEPDPVLVARPETPAALDHVLKRCLAKDPDDRWQTAHDLLIQLRWVAGLGAVTAPAADRRRVVQIVAAGALVMLAAVATPLALYLRGSTTPQPFQYRTPVVGLNSSEISVSPDGQLLAFMARPNQQGPASIFVRPVNGLAARRLAGTDDATQLFWSPDSRFIAFAAGGKLKKVEAIGGPSQEIASVEGFGGGTWNAAGLIVFGSPKGLFSVSAEGGKPTPVTTVEKNETGHLWPHFLPDGRHFLYQAWSSEANARTVFTGTLDSKDKTKLMAGETNVAYAEPGYLVFHREATVFAQPFDADERRFTGDAVQIAGGVAFDASTGRGTFAVSQRDVLVYFQGDAGAGGPLGRGGTLANVQLGWVSRTGPILAGAGDAATQGDFDVSPDGRLVAVTRADGAGADIWMIDWQRAGTATRLTRDPSDDINPVWSADGTLVAFTTYRKGNADVYTIKANGTAADVPLLESPANEIVEGWSPDGKYILYLFGKDNLLDIWALPQFGDKKPFPVVQGGYQKNEPQVSFDGKWMTYTSDESGRFEVYVVDFPAGNKKLKVSRDGGGQPRWRQDGREIVFRSLEGAIMTAEIKAGAEIEAGIPQTINRPAVITTMTTDATRHQLSIAPDGQRLFLRVGNAQVPQGGRAGAGTPQAATVYDPVTAQAGGRGNLNFNAGFGAGRGAAAGSAGLTVIRNWHAIAAERIP